VTECVVLLVLAFEVIVASVQFV